MATDDQTRKPAWEAPGATALTGAESRADRSDHWMQNCEVISG